MDDISAHVRSGKPVIILDSERSAICIAAEVVSGETVNFMMKNCDEIRLALTWRQILQLGLNRFRFQNGNVIPIDPNLDRISAEDRAKFIRELISGNAKEIKYPGRIFVEETKEMGVLERPGIAEACVDLAKMAGLHPSAVYATLLTEKGCVAGEEYALEFAKNHCIPVFRIKDMIEHRIKSEKIIKRVVEATLPTKFYGTFKAVGYSTPLGEIIALVRGKVDEGDVLVRIHSECLTGDVFHSLRCDCGDQLENALKMIDREDKGVAIYMRGHEGRGIGLINKLMAYKLQEEGKDTVDANIELGFPPDLRSYGIVAQILMDLGVKSIRLLTNNPLKLEELRKYGFKIKREPIQVEPSEENLQYLKAKKDRMGHLICFND